MPYKCQTEGFRNRKGINYICHGDILESNPRIKAIEIVKQLRKDGFKAFYERHIEAYDNPDCNFDFYRVFVEKRWLKP